MNPNDAIPYSAASFQGRIGGTNFRRLSQYWAQNHLLRVDISEAFLKWWFFAELYGLQSVNTVPNGHKFSNNLSFQSSPELHRALFQVLLQLRLSSQSVFLNDFINSLLVGFSWGCSRATATRLILDARVPIFKMFHPSSNTASTHAHTSISTLNSVVNISSRNLPFNKKFNDGTLMKWKHRCRPFCITCLWSCDASYWCHTSLKDMTLVGATYKTILNRLMLQSCQLCDGARNFQYDPHINHIVLECVFRNVRLKLSKFFIHRRIHRWLSKSNIKIYIKIAPTCSGAVTPSSGSALFVLAKVTLC